jgi:molybdate transport system regulatory protein
VVTSSAEEQCIFASHGDAALTPFGLSLVERYRKIKRAAATAVRRELQALRTEIGRPKKS